MPNVYDMTGVFLCNVTYSYLDKALSRGEVGQTEDGVYLMIGTGYWNDLTPLEKYNLRKAKERKARNG